MNRTHGQVWAAGNMFRRLTEAELVETRAVIRRFPLSERSPWVAWSTYRAIYRSEQMIDRWRRS